MRLRLLRLLPAFLLAAAAPESPQAHPAMWKIADADTTIYLLGTIHVLPSEYRWRDPRIDEAVRQAQCLTLETVLDEDPGGLGKLLLSMGKGPGLPPLAERVPAGKRAALAAMVEKSGFPPALLDGMKTWAAAIVLTGTAINQIGLEGGSGVEGQLTTTFRHAKKPVTGLETPEQQLGFFDRLPEESQRGFLLATLDDRHKVQADFRDMLKAWSKGDPRRIERAFAKDPEFTPELADLLIRQRDAAWAEKLTQRMKKPGVVLVAVGAGHLVGPNSVQAMLAAKGIQATRVE